MPVKSGAGSELEVNWQLIDRVIAAVTTTLDQLFDCSQRVEQVRSELNVDAARARTGLASSSAGQSFRGVWEDKLTGAKVVKMAEQPTASWRWTELRARREKKKSWSS